MRCWTTNRRYNNAWCAYCPFVMILWQFSPLTRNNLLTKKMRRLRVPAGADSFKKLLLQEIISDHHISSRSHAKTWLKLHVNLTWGQLIVIEKSRPKCPGALYTESAYLYRRGMPIFQMFLREVLLFRLLPCEVFFVKCFFVHFQMLIFQNSYFQAIIFWISPNFSSAYFQGCILQSSNAYFFKEHESWIHESGRRELQNSGVLRTRIRSLVDFVELEKLRIWTSWKSNRPNSTELGRSRRVRQAWEAPTLNFWC